MAQEPKAPWSRWDSPDVQYATPNNQPRPFAGQRPQYDFPGGYALPYSDSASTSLTPQKLVGAKLVSKEISDFDPAFYNCVYGVPNVSQQIIQQCRVDIGCCETTCCDDNWRTKYGWALALLCLFCILVLASVLIWLVFWLINRSRDKRQRKLLEAGHEGMTPASSQMNISPYATAGYPPPSPAFVERSRKHF
ncbi:hypothetical protein Ddc_00788 [Ditylenchus destructor]|nr:hypothetical protein Ddc_00788 [Ditylenchus destructor]